MRNLILALFICVTMHNIVSAQEEDTIWCGSTEATNEVLDDKWYQIISNFQDDNENRVDQNNIICTGANSVVVPVAFHFNGGIDCTNQACLISLVETEIDQWNQDFAGMNPGTADYYTFSASCPNEYPIDALAEEGTCIQFCLATENHPVQSGISDGQPAITVGEHAWPSAAGWSGYLNVFVSDVNPIGPGVAGVAFLGAGLTADGTGIWLINDVFGSAGTSCSSGILMGNSGRGTEGTHEIGHWFGLPHTFDNNDGACNGSDGVGDTPQQASANFGCPTVNLATCTSTANNTCSPNEFFFNFMDYSNCMMMFTEDQAQIMNSYANNNQFMDVSLVCGGQAITEIDDCVVDQAPEPYFTPDNGSTLFICSSGSTVISFTDFTDELPSGWTWSFSGAGVSPTSSTNQNPSVTVNMSGTLTVTLTATNALGTSSLTQTYTVVIDDSLEQCQLGNICDDAVDISEAFQQCDGVYGIGPYDMTNATSEPSDESYLNYTGNETDANGVCCQCEYENGETPPSELNSTLWYYFTVPTTGSYTIDALAQSSSQGCGAVFGNFEDTQFMVYASADGTCNTLSFVGCSEDGPIASGTNYPAGTSLTLVAGTVYYLIVDEYYASGLEGGQFCLEIGRDFDGDCCPTNVYETITDTQPEYCGSSDPFIFSNLIAAFPELSVQNSLYGSVQWSTGNYLSAGGTGITDVYDLTFTAENCEILMEMVYLNVLCTDIPANPTLDGGFITVTVYPDLSTQNLAVAGDETCGPVLNLPTECAGLSVNNDLDGNGSIPDYSNITGMGTVTFTVTQPGIPALFDGTTCSTLEIEASYNCEVICDDCGDSTCTSVMPCDDNDPCTINDEETILTLDNSVCVPCAGTDNTPTCNDTDICTNGGSYILDANCECVIDVATIEGCMSSTACNFDSNANCDDNSCIEPDGCTDAAFCEYDPNATCDDGSCVTSNADPGTCDDGDCTNGLETWDVATCACISNPPSGVNGCTDAAFCEYNPNADCDDGSCVTSNTDPGTCDDGDCNNGLETWDMATCTCVSNPPGGVNGCTDAAFCEYDPNADCDDGSCATPNTDPGTCNADCNAGDLEIWDTSTCACIVDQITVLGCTDPESVNYDSNANCDDGSCICEDEIAGNFDFFEMGCDLTGIEVTIYDATGAVVGTTTTTDATGSYLLPGGPYVCGSYSAELTNGIPDCYLETGGITGPLGFVVNGDGTPDGAIFVANPLIPTLSQWGLICLALLLMTFGALRLSQQVSLNIRE